VGWSTQRTVGIAVGAAGIVGIVVGSVFGGKAMSADSDSHAHCLAPEFTRCDPQGQQLGKDAFSAATASTVGFLIGGAGLVGGVVAFLTAPSGAPKSGSGALRFDARPIVGGQVSGLVLSGQW
jgi:serine/threonine-protein kinase